MSSPPSIGILGGTFDPVHDGHLSIALETRRRLGLDQMRLLPAGTPVHRSPPLASAEHRLAMLRLAVAPYPELSIDTRELSSTAPNYMLLTLQSLRAEFPASPFLLVVGEDAFAQLPGWYQWEALFDEAHVVVVNRVDSVFKEVSAYKNKLLELLAARQTVDPALLTGEPAGRIYRLSLPPHPASSTAIRAMLMSKTCAGQAAATDRDLAGLLPAAVLAYIARHSLYQAPAHGR